MTYDMYMNIGYPLGYTVENHRIQYILDMGDTYQYLTQREFDVWSSGNSQNNIFDELLHRKCILNLRNESDINLFWDCKIIRQGIGSVYQNKHSINLGIYPIYVTETQMGIWRMAKIQFSLKELCDALNMDMEDFIGDISILLKYDLVFLQMNV